MKLRLSAQARTQYGEILRYTRDRFGAAQVDSYEARFQKAFETLLDYPEAGYAAGEALQGARAYRVGRHQIFYRLSDDFIDILAILHDSQLPGRLLNE